MASVKPLLGALVRLFVAYHCQGSIELFAFDGIVVPGSFLDLCERQDEDYTKAGSVIETHSLVLLVGFGLFNFDATRA